LSYYERAKKEAESWLSDAKDDVWEEKPVSVEEFFQTFIKEPFYEGHQQEFVDAVLGTNPEEWDTTYTEGIALWGKGSGKDRTAAKILTYVIYKLMCMRDPVKYLSVGREEGETFLSIEDKIEIGNVCINARLAKTVFFKYFKIMLKNCINPETGKNWFEERGVNFRRDVKTNMVEFPKNISAYSLDSKEYTGEGLNLFFVIFDEIAGFEVDKAEELYKALRSTCMSRFPQYFKILLLSYKRSDNDYMMVRFEQSKEEPRVFRSLGATWEVNKLRKRGDFAEDYAQDPEVAQRTYECTGATSEGGFFRYRTRISQVINTCGRENPIIDDLQNVIDLRSLRFKDWFKPEENTVYFIHVDLAKGNIEGGNDACGFAMGHFRRDMSVTLPQDYIEAVVRDTGQDPKSLKELDGQKRVGAIMDLVLQIRAPASGEIMFEEIREFIKYLKKEVKFPIQLVTYDGFQSMDSIQELRKSGVNAEEFSVDDKDRRAYNTLKNCIYQGVFECYPHKTFIREAEELVIAKNGKVDHPEKSSRRYQYEDKITKGSKDVADAVAGCVAKCIEHGKSSFNFWVSGQPGGGHTIQKEELKTPKQVQQYESEELVKYGEKPPSWYKRGGFR